MCGIFGSFNCELTDEDIMKMANSLKHRGPDEDGIYRTCNVTLGITRLKIVGGQNGVQPLRSEDGRIVLVFNGEIFNYANLRRKLTDIGHSFRSDSDGEVLIHLYEEYGTNMFSYINGQFAFSLYDSDENKLISARDQTGICPLYYMYIGDSVYFASEVKALASLNKKKLIFNPEHLYEQFVYWSTIDGRTVYQDVYQVPSSSYVIFKQNGKKEAQRYHRFQDSDKSYEFRDWDEIKKSLYELLENSIRDRIMCDDDVKWGMYLSGGLDSTIILKLLDKMRIKGVTAFSLAFQSRKMDESIYQKLACKDCGVDHNVIEISEQDIIDNLSKVLEHCEMPIYKFGAVPMYILSKEVRKKGIKFVLSGEGADELFYGYDIYKEVFLRKYLSNQNNSTVRMSNLADVVPPQVRRDPFIMEGYSQYYKSYTNDVGNLLFSIRPRINASSLLYEYFNPEIQQKIDRNQIDQRIVAHYERSGKLGMFEKCQNVLMDNLLTGYLLSVQGDRVLMANSVEGRFPFLDPRLISFAYSIPAYLKLHGYNEKYILKETFANILPKQIRTRQKFQYSTPGSNVIKEHLDYFQNFLTKQACEDCGVFQYSLVRKLIKEERQSITTDMVLVYITSTHILQKILNGWGV